MINNTDLGNKQIHHTFTTIAFDRNSNCSKKNQNNRQTNKSDTRPRDFDFDVSPDGRPDGFHLHLPHHSNNRMHAHYTDKRQTQVKKHDYNTDPSNKQIHHTFTTIALLTATATAQRRIKTVNKPINLTPGHKTLTRDASDLDPATLSASFTIVMAILQRATNKTNTS